MNPSEVSLPFLVMAGSPASKTASRVLLRCVPGLTRSRLPSPEPTRAPSRPIWRPARRPAWISYWRPITPSSIPTTRQRASAKATCAARSGSRASCNTPDGDQTDRDVIAADLSGCEGNTSLNTCSSLFPALSSGSKSGESAWHHIPIFVPARYLNIRASSIRHC